jgi:hypothetical protein
VELDLLPVLEGDFLESAVLGGHDLLVVLLEKRLLLTDDAQFLEDLVVLIPQRA